MWSVGVSLGSHNPMALFVAGHLPILFGKICSVFSVFLQNPYSISLQSPVVPTTTCAFTFTDLHHDFRGSCLGPVVLLHMFSSFPGLFSKTWIEATTVLFSMPEKLTSPRHEDLLSSSAASFWIRPVPCLSALMHELKETFWSWHLNEQVS